MNKKAYTTPTMDIVRIAQTNICASSTVTLDVMGGSGDGSTASEDNTITTTNYSSMEFNSNAFEGGLMDE